MQEGGGKTTKCPCESIRGARRREREAKILQDFTLVLSQGHFVVFPPTP